VNLFTEEAKKLVLVRTDLMDVYMVESGIDEFVDEFVDCRQMILRLRSQWHPFNNLLG
jgi:hypothetical protein